jgi:hypothetical protein
MVYEDTATEITKVKIDSIRGQELTGDKFTEYSTPPELDSMGSITLSPDTLRDGIKERLLEIAEKLTIGAGYATAHNGVVYSVLLKQVRARFLKNSIGLADHAELNYTWKMLDQVQKNFESVPGLIAGVIEYGTE